MLTLPYGHRGPATGLRQEQERRLRNSEPSFEFFAPSYVEVKNIDGRFVNTRRPLLFNYVFVQSSESEIRRMKQYLPQYNFLPRVWDSQSGHFPFLSDEAMHNLQWIARSYSNELPVFIPDAERLIKGDRIRITKGQFKGAEACVVARVGGGRKEVVACIENWMWVPLLHVRPDEYEVIALHEEGKHLYTRLDNDALFSKLHEAMGRKLSTGGLTDQDRALATETLRQYGKLQVSSILMRCKLLSMLILTHTLLDAREEQERLVAIAQQLIPLLKAEQTRAALFVTLYGSTDSALYHDRAHEIIDLWRSETSPKKSKARLIRQLDDYDKWLGHETGLKTCTKI